MVAIFGAAVVAAIAWLYQRAWERYERRIERYQEIIDRLPAFTVGALSADGIDEALREGRRLWLLGPDEVVRAWNAFLATIIVEEGPKSDEEKERKLAELVLAMRRDATFLRAIVPPIFGTKLRAEEIKLQSATRR